VRSVLLPYRDAAPTLAEAIASTLADLAAGDELLLVDDGSTDGSAAIAARFATDARVRTIATGGTGLVGALQRGLAAARHELVARMDADDVVLSGRFDAQTRALEADPSLAAVGCRVQIASIGVPLGDGLRRYVDWQNALVTPDEHARDRFVESPLCHPSVMLRKSAVLGVGGYRDVGWPEDWDLWLRLIAAGHRLGKVTHEGLVWRHRAGRETFSARRCSEEALRRARAHHLVPWLRGAGARHEGAPLAVWGAGATGRRLARAMAAEGFRASKFYDIDPRKVGRTAHGAPIHDANASTAAPGAETLVVAVGARGARAEVRGKLAARGFVELEDFVCAA
jgi:glycosyltransferase involved in cell wall biosynthesis